MVDELVIIDKPVGMTSFDVIRVLRRKLGIKKMGHAGTLDPLASGVLVIGIGKGTKLLKDVIKLDKTYEVEVLLGKKTETGDLEGIVIQESDIELNKWNKEYIKQVLQELVGDLELQVPKYSAVKINGKRLYEKARRGEFFEPPKRIMKVYSIKLNSIRYENNKAYLNLELNVASGTYIRSVVDALGEKLRVPATLSKLRRTRVGNFRIEDARKLEDF